MIIRLLILVCILINNIVKEANSATETSAADLLEMSDPTSLSRKANDCMLDGNHKEAFDCYGILVALNPKDHIARYHLAGYLIQGITGSLEPKEADRLRACQLLLESSWLEMTEHSDEPNNAGRLLSNYVPDVYSELSAIATTRRPIEDNIKESLQARLFAKIKDMPKDPF